MNRVVVPVDAIDILESSKCSSAKELPALDQSPMAETKRILPRGSVIAEVERATEIVNALTQHKWTTLSPDGPFMQNW
jgi:hypothetical protein